MSYSPGSIVYAKLKGYPWWPARVEVESSLPSQVRSKKPKTPKPTIGVRFFGTKDYGWFGSNDLKPFDKKDAEITLQKMKKRDKLLERSIQNESKKSSESYDNEEDEGEYSKRSKIRNKGNKKNKKTTTSKGSDHRRTKSLSGGKSKKKSHTYSSEEDDDVNNDGKGGKKRRASEGATIKRKQRKIDYTDDEKMDLDEDKSEDETKKKERRQNVKKDRASRSEGSKSSDNESPEDDRIKRDINEDDESKSSRLESEIHHRPSKSRHSRTPGEWLLHLRHKLQRMTLKDDVESLDMDKIDEVFTEVENFKITIPLLKESKIGKLMRKIAEKDFDPDPKKIIERSNELIRKWKCLLETPTQEGSDEETSPKTVNQVESPNLDEVVYNEKSDILLSYEQEIDNKKIEENVDNNIVDNNIVKVENEKFPSAMDVDDTNEAQSKTGEEKLVVENKDNIVTNGSSPAANNQEVNSHEKEDIKNTTLEL
ncbi:16399_t:CDS:2 [Funneliformis mosseae]|uniref:16399_t:CDS:1 n=1 Tax=Funneliformis mosseae TaxID=27381 RepID=A0A9N8Z7G4_FUNMO|nr:16399_t:CDS:2 [Funneliformis mosseae]